MISLFNNPFVAIGMFLAFLVAITVHECAHAWAADRLGDPTAKLMGRLTLNPLAHLDFFGTLMLLFAPFGWAKPVQVDAFNLRNPRRDGAIISLAGPAANLILALLLAIFMQILLHTLLISILNTLPGLIIYTFFRLLILLNVNLAIFNLVPIHPLDGFAVVEGLLPEQYAKQWKDLRPYGMIFLLFLVFPVFGGEAPLTKIISPVIDFILSILIPGSGVI
jgi:Zn-dependent protease